MVMNIEDYVNYINGLSDEDLSILIKDDKCPYEPERDGKVPTGMYHCPLCGEMVLARVCHPRGVV